MRVTNRSLSDRYLSLSPFHLISLKMLLINASLCSKIMKSHVKLCSKASTENTLKKAVANLSLCHPAASALAALVHIL